MPINGTAIQNINGVIWLCQFGTYDNSSVIAGYPFRQLCKPYDSLEQAIADNPDAEVLVDQDLTPEPIHISSLPPAWFDPANAGEVWSEDDY